MRILVLHGALDHANLGDNAMLTVAVERLKQLWPQASLHIPTHSAATLQAMVPEAIPVDAHGCQSWLDSTGGAWNRLGLRPRSAREFGEAVTGADFVVLAGSGLITDSFAGTAMRVLRVLEGAITRGIPTAILSQGFGPMRNPELVKLAAAVLPRVGLILLRDPESSLTMLRNLGVPDNQIAVTGDDTVELAYRARKPELGDAIGVNLRDADYAEWNSGNLAAVQTVLLQNAQSRRTSLVGIPIALGKADSDERTLRRLFPSATELKSPRTLLDVIQQIFRCRLVVCGSYHAAVFALAQGIPTIALAASEYYRHKFKGLASLFGAGCQVLRADDVKFPALLSAAINQFWPQAERLRPALLTAAERQITNGHRAYSQLQKLVQSPRAFANSPDP